MSVRNSRRIKIKRIPKFQDYSITNSGRVYSHKWGKVKEKVLRINKYGYVVVKIEGQWRPVHSLVASTYIEERPPGFQVNHKDGNKLNNCVENLEYVSQRDNLLHAMRTGLHDNPEVPVVGINKHTLLETFFVSQAEAARVTGAQQPNINKCLFGHRNSAGGYYWRLDID